MLEIPGYRWDEATKRYYKDDRRPLQTAARPAAGSAVQEPSKRPSSNKTQSLSASAPKKAPRTGNWRSFRTPSYLLLDALSSRPFNASLQAGLRERSVVATFSNLREARTERPNLPQGDAITCFEFDKEHPDVIRYGTTAGLIGRGRLNTHRTQSHSVDEWDMEHILGAPISSVHMSRGFFVGTSLGPIAQAVFGRTDSPSHVKFAPRQTSLWSSSIWERQVALGCDKKVLYSRNPADQAFQSFGTASAVFALDLHEEELFVGTRSGHVRLFDVKQRGRRADAPAPQVLLRLRSPITHIKRLADRTFIVAQMNGDLARFDARWLKERLDPVTQYSGHVNTQTRTVGLDIWDEKVIAAGASYLHRRTTSSIEAEAYPAGEDGIVRKWILSNGCPIPGTISAQPSGETAPRDNPIQFQPFWPAKASLWVTSGRTFHEYA